MIITSLLLLLMTITSLLAYLVPCYRRCHQMSVIPENEKVIRLDEDDEEGWVDTHHGVGKSVQ